jgi:predicted RND superfamily exporter protein
MIARSLAWLGRRIAARPGAFAAVSLAFALAGAAAVSRMHVKTDLLDAFPAGKPSLTAFTDFARDFGALDELVVVVSTPAPAPEQLIAAADAIGERLAESPLIESVDFNAMRSGSRLMAANFPAWLDPKGVARLAGRLSPEGIRGQMRRNREAILSPFAGPMESELVARDPLGLRDIVRDSVSRGPVPKGIDLTTGYYMDASQTVALVMARPRGGSRDMAFVGRLNREVARIVAEARAETGDASVSVGVTGGYARAAEAAAAIWRDMVVSFGVSLVLVLGAVWLAYRPSGAVVAAFAASLFAALSWTMLLARVMYGDLNIVTSVVAAMLIGMYVDYLIQVYARFEECLRATGDRGAALETTMAGTGKAVVTGSLTTAVSFFAIVVTSFRGLHELGLVAGFGVLLCLVASLVLMPALLSLIARRSPARIAAGRPGGIPVEWAARWVERRRKAVLAGFAVALLASAGGAACLRFETDLDALGLRDSPAMKVQKTVEQRFGRQGEPLFLVARAADDRRLAGDFDAMERFGASLRETGAVGTFSSPGLLLPPPSAQERALDAIAASGVARRYTGDALAAAVRRAMAAEGMRPDPSLDGYAAGVVAALSRGAVVPVTALAASGDPRTAYFYNPARRALAAHLTSPGDRWDDAAAARIEAAVRKLGSDFTLVGPRIIVNEIRTSIILESGLAIAISFLANILIVWLHFRSAGAVWRVMLPLTAGALLTVGAMGLTGVAFNFFNVAALALISGFGVDYGIYLMQAHREGGGCGGAGAVRRMGDRVALCAVTTVISCGSLVTTQYRGLASLGLVLSYGALFSLLAALLLLPALIGPEDAARGGSE